MLNALPKSAQPSAKAALAEIWNVEEREQAEAAAKALATDYGTNWPKAVAKITDDPEVLLAFYDYPPERWIHLRTTNPIESTFATARLRQQVTKGPGSRAAGVAMAFKLIESAQARWRAVNAPHLVALVRACATFGRGLLVERPDETTGKRVTRQSTGYDHGMSKLIVSVLTSLDGYYEGPEKNLAPMPFEDAFNTHNLGLLQRAGTLVYGSTWFPGNWEHWSAVAADESQNDRDHEIAELVTSLDAVVISDSMKVDPDATWAATTRVVSRAEAPKEIARLKRGSGDDLLMFGSATTWNPLLADGLVDELVVLVGAALLGDGSKLYSGSRAGLKLLAARVLPDSQLVELRYDATGAGD